MATRREQVRVARFGLGVGLSLACAIGWAQAQEDEVDLTQEQAKALQPPATLTAADIQKGAVLYLQNCAMCHGEDGKAQVDAMANNAADLTDPETWKQGASEGETFRSISQGAGNAMPPFRSVLTPAQLWAIVAHLMSLRSG
jgi:mono/diheme cytochrome c family protein